MRELQIRQSPHRFEHSGFEWGGLEHFCIWKKSTRFVCTSGNAETNKGDTTMSIESQLNKIQSRTNNGNDTYAWASFGRCRKSRSRWGHRAGWAWDRKYGIHGRTRPRGRQTCTLHKRSRRSRRRLTERREASARHGGGGSGGDSCGRLGWEVSDGGEGKWGVGKGGRREVVFPALFEFRGSGRK